MKVVIDTNVLVAVMLGKEGSAARKVLEIALQNQITPLVGEALFNEYWDVLSREDLMRHCPLDTNERLEFLSAFLACCEWCRIYFGWRPNLKDEGDNHLIELALAGRAKYIISNNIRDLKSGDLIFDDLQIVTPQTFIQEALWA